MPEIKLQHVISCSSEDKNYASDNLLKGDGFKKWRGSSAGEKQVSVTIQFEKASHIQQIDIGNDGSAFVEVLVAKSSAARDDFQVILVASAFMSPLDSRAGKNISSVRMFTADKLSKSAVDQKWDKVKVVCTQPFNKSIQYGLAFIKFHSPPAEGSTSTAPAAIQSKLGAFKLKSEESETIKPGSLFSNRGKEKIPSPPLTGAAAVRAASKLAEEAHTPEAMKKKSDVMEAKSSTTHRDTTQVKRKHDGSHTTGSSKRLSTELRQHSDAHVTPLRKQSTGSSSETSSRSKVKDTKSTQKKKTSEHHKSSQDVPFNELMKKVVFVISGYQNPERGNIRDKAMEMGAKYCPSWDKSCTHLICAFESTPKYNEIKGKGRIVNKDWIKASYKARQLLPWRKYRVGRARSPGGSTDTQSESDDDIAVRKPSKEKPARTESMEAGPSKSPIKQQVSDPYGADTESESADDTDDEIKRFKTEKNQQSPKKSSVQDNDIYDASTDDEMENGTTNGTSMAPSDSELPPLPDIFKGKKFFFYGDFTESVRRKMLRFVTAYNGAVEDYVTDGVAYVLTDSDWDDNFDKALSDNPSLAFIRPDWVYSCDEHQKYMPHQKYAVIPK